MIQCSFMLLFDCCHKHSYYTYRKLTKYTLQSDFESHVHISEPENIQRVEMKTTALKVLLTILIVLSLHHLKAIILESMIERYEAFTHLFLKELVNYKVL